MPCSADCPYRTHNCGSIRWAGEALYYQPPSGWECRVYDCRWVRGTYHIVPLGSLEANYRVFVTIHGDRRASRLLRPDDHPITEWRLFVDHVNAVF